MRGAGSERVMSLLLYSVNGTGLGHLTRLLSIARWLRTLLNALDYQARIYFLSCNEADFLIRQEGFPSFKMPSKATLRDAQMSDFEALQVIRGFAAAAIDAIQPDIAVVDTFPTGSYDELIPLLGREETKRVFVFREQRSDYATKLPYEQLLEPYDLLLLPHPADSFELPFEPQPGLEVAWAGNVVFGERTDLWTKAKVRKSLGLDHRKFVVYVSAGGGGDPDARKTLQTISDIALDVPNSHLVVGVGPLSRELMPSRRRQTWTNTFPISRLFRGFDIAISGSGYNTVHELLHFGLPAVLFAQTRGADDQWARAKWVEDEGAGIAVEQLSREALTGAINQLTDKETRQQISARAQGLVPSNGARRAAEAILSTALGDKVSDLGRASA